LSDDAFHNIGVPHFGPGKQDGIDEGRFLVTGEDSGRFAFRTLPLRNVAITGPYMHNGSVGSLREAIEQHLEPERTLDDGSFVAPSGELVTLDPAVGEAIRATISPDVRPLRPLDETEIDALTLFLEALSSNTEAFGLPPAAAEPLTVPSGLSVQGSSPARAGPPRF
jgi:cytochrome c peroxidase